MVDSEEVINLGSKKKKKTVNLDELLGKSDEVDDVIPSKAEPDAEDKDELDLQNLKKKKKKKKTVFTLDENEGKENGTSATSVPSDDITAKKPSEDNLDQVAGNVDDLADDLEEGLQLNKKKKKKKSTPIVPDEKKVSFHEPGDEPFADDSSNIPVSEQMWSGSDRDYTYDELLTRVFDIMRRKNPQMIAGEKKRFIMKPPQCARVGTKKTSFVNFNDICQMLHRQPKHVIAFILAELGTSGSVDANNQLIIKGRFQQKQLESVLRRYIKEYVTCHTCKSPDTLLERDVRLYFLRCRVCQSRCSVAAIKSGFQAVTNKRARMRAKALA